MGKHLCWSLFINKVQKQTFTDVLQNNCSQQVLQISQESNCVGVFFNKVAGLQKCNFIKKSLQHSFFIVNFVNYPRTPTLQIIYEGLLLKQPVRLFKNTFFPDHLQWLLLTVPGFQPAALLKNRLGEKCLSTNFVNFLRTSFVRTPPDDSFLCLSVNFEIFRSPLLQSTSGNCLFYLQVVEFQPPHTVSKYFICAFQAFYTRRRRRTRRRSSYSKGQKKKNNNKKKQLFMYLKSMKIICEEVNL